MEREIDTEKQSTMFTQAERLIIRHSGAWVGQIFGAFISYVGPGFRKIRVNLLTSSIMQQLKYSVLETKQGLTHFVK